MRLFVLTVLIVTSSAGLTADDPRTTQGASGALAVTTSTQACKCTIDESFISERSLSFQKAQAEKMMKGFEEWKAKSNSTK